MRGFKVALPLTDDPGIECRTDGHNDYHKFLFTFNNPLTAVHDIVASCGDIVITKIDRNDRRLLRASLVANGCNANYVTITLIGLHDDQGHTLGEAAVTFGLLLGDVNSDGMVDEDDAALVEADLGARTDESNFREDIDTNNRIDAEDLAVVESQIGSMLPP
jgi:hypothetical protein